MPFRASKLPLARPTTNLLLLGLLTTAGCEPGQESASSAAVFEGARLIVGDRSPPVENAAFVVDGGRFAQVGTLADLEEWPGAERVDLTGMTVMPAIVDTHTHLNQEREALIEDRRARARYGVSAAMSLGRDTRDLAIRGEDVPGAARFRSAGVGITSPEPGRSEIPYWVTTEGEARQAVRDQAARQVDIIKIWVDDRNGRYTKLSPELYGAIIDEAHEHSIRVTAHIFSLEDAKGLLRAGIDAFAHGVWDKDVEDEVIGLFKERPAFVLVPNLPSRGVATDLTSEFRTCDQLGLSNCGRSQRLARGRTEVPGSLASAFGAFHYEGPRAGWSAEREPGCHRRAGLTGVGAAWDGRVHERVSLFGSRWCAPLPSNGLRRPGERGAAQPERAGHAGRPFAASGCSAQDWTSKLVNSLIPAPTLDGREIAQGRLNQTVVRDREAGASCPGSEFRDWAVAAVTSTWPARPFPQIHTHVSNIRRLAISGVGCVQTLDSRRSDPSSTVSHHWKAS